MSSQPNVPLKKIPVNKRGSTASIALVGKNTLDRHLERSSPEAKNTDVQRKGQTGNTPAFPPTNNTATNLWTGRTRSYLIPWRAKKKSALQYNLRLRESLHIAKENCGPGYGLNEDWGGHLYTRVWHPLFQKMR